MAASTRIDFLSPEFNRTDDLDDNTGNYRTFHSLEGIVTSDMRHHQERKNAKSTPHEHRGEPAEKPEANRGAPEAEGQSPARSLTVVSRGRTLIIGADIERAIEYGKFLIERGLNCTVCVPTHGRNEYYFPRKGPLGIIEADTVSVSGCFGGFTVTAGSCGDKADMSTLPGDEFGVFDLVLDLQSTPSFTGKMLPIGYFAPGESTAAIDEALAEMPEMRGRFTKPQFTVLNENRCLHGRSRTHDCRRCLDICPVSAITSADRRIAVDPYLCQGCGGCALVCPADAIRMVVPPQEELLSELAGLLSAAAAGGNPSPDLIFCDLDIRNNAPDRHDVAGAAESDRIVFEVEEIGRIGLDVLLFVLARGAGRVTLSCGAGTPVPVRQALERETELGKVILQGLHLPADRIRLLVVSPEMIHQVCNDVWDEGAPSVPVEPLTPPAGLTFERDKRALTRMAARHLFEVSGARQPSITLPADAPFGAIAIDAAACSLCMTCVGSCPSGALKAGGEHPCISFVESLCHQCGHCAEACPEDAVQLLPRLLCTEAADIPRVLRETEPFTCIECGEPFASQAVISRMREKLHGHWMYSSDRQLQRLQMCRTCRTRDALTAGDFRS